MLSDLVHDVLLIVTLVGKENMASQLTIPIFTAYNILFQWRLKGYRFVRLIQGWHEEYALKSLLERFIILTLGYF